MKTENPSGTASVPTADGFSATIAVVRGPDGEINITVESSADTGLSLLTHQLSEVGELMSPALAEGAEDREGVRVIANALKATTKAMLDLRADGRLRQRLSDDRREPAVQAVAHLADSLLTTAWDVDITDEGLARRLDAATAAAQAVTVVSERQLAQIELVLHGLAPDQDLEASKRRGEERIRQLYDRIIMDSYSTGQLSKKFRIKRQRAHQLRQEDKLFAIRVPQHRGLLHPVWQFVDMAPRPEMSQLIKQAREARLSAIELHTLMTNPNLLDDGETLLKHFEAGNLDLVLAVIMSGGE